MALVGSPAEEPVDLVGGAPLEIRWSSTSAATTPPVTSSTARISSSPIQRRGCRCGRAGSRLGPGLGRARRPTAGDLAVLADGDRAGHRRWPDRGCGDRLPALLGLSRVLEQRGDRRRCVPSRGDTARTFRATRSGSGGRVDALAATADQRDRLAQPALQVRGAVRAAEHLGQRGDHVVRGRDGRQPVPRWVAEDLVADLIKGGGDAGPDLAGRGPAPAEQRRIRQAVRGPARPAGDQTGVQQSAEIGDIDEFRGVGALHDRGARRPQRCLDHQPHDLDVAGRGDDHRARVDPPVVEAEAVHTGQRAGDLADHPGRLQPGERGLAQDHVQRLAGGVLADDVGPELQDRCSSPHPAPG